MNQALSILRQLRQAIIELNLETIFHTYDQNQDDWLDFQEFSKLVRVRKYLLIIFQQKINNLVSNDQIQILFSIFDSNNDSKISIEEFKLAVEIQYSQYEPYIQSFFKELSKQIKNIQLLIKRALNQNHLVFDKVFLKHVYQNNIALNFFREEIEQLGINTAQSQSVYNFDQNQQLIFQYQIVVQELQHPTDTQILDYSLFKYYFNKYKISAPKILSGDELALKSRVSMQIQAAMNKNHLKFEQAFGKYDRNQSGSITTQNFFDFITKDLGLQNDNEKQAFAGIIGNEQGKIQISNLKQSILQNQNNSSFQMSQTQIAPLQKFQQKISQSFNSEQQALHAILNGYDRVPYQAFCEKISNLNLLTHYEIQDVARALDPNQQFITQYALQSMIFSQISPQQYSQALPGVQQIQSPKSKQSLQTFGRVQSIQINQDQSQQYQQSQNVQQISQQFQQQPPPQQQQQFQLFPQESQQQSQFFQQQQQQQQQQQTPPPQLYQQQQSFGQHQFQQQQQQSQFYQQQAQPQFQQQAPPPQIQQQQFVPPSYQQQVQNNVVPQYPQGWQQQSQIDQGWQQQPQFSQIQQQQQNNNDLSQLKDLIDGLTDHGYELKMLLQDGEILAYSIQMELQKIQKDKFFQIGDINHLVQATQSFKPNGQQINLDKLLESCKILREKNYKLEQDQLKQDTLIEQIRQKIQNYLRNNEISLRTFFRQLAINNDKQIERKEFQVGIKKKLKIDLDDIQTAQLFKRLDQNSDFQLSYEEFSSFMQMDQKIEVQPILRKMRKKILKSNVSDLRQVFSQIDTNKDSKVSFKEWEQAMKSLGLDLDFDDISAIFKHFDKNSEDSINYQEFETTLLGDHMNLKQWVKSIQAYGTQNTLTEQAIFRKFNQQGKDLMSLKEFKLFLQAIDPITVKSFDDEQYEDIFNLFDQDNDYQISLSEFLQLINTHKEFIFGQYSMNNMNQYMNNMNQQGINNMNLQSMNNMNQQGINNMNLQSMNNMNQQGINNMNLQSMNNMNLQSKNLQSMNNPNLQSINNMNIQLQAMQFQEMQFYDERPILIKIAKEMQNKNILTVGDLFKTKDQFVLKTQYFQVVQWLGFNPNDMQILSLCTKLTNPNDLALISVDWFEQALIKIGGLQQQSNMNMQSHVMQFQEMQFYDERPILIKIAKEMQNKNILTVGDLFKTKDQFVLKTQYFQVVQWLGFNPNDMQILSLCTKLTNPNDLALISVDWFEQALIKIGGLYSQSNMNMPSHAMQFNEMQFQDEQTLLIKMAKEMQKKSILTVSDLFKTRDKFVLKSQYFQVAQWLGFNPNDMQILSLGKKLTNPEDFSQISVDWFEQALKKLGNLGQHVQQQFGQQQNNMNMPSHAMQFNEMQFQDERALLIRMAKEMQQNKNILTVADLFKTKDKFVLKSQYFQVIQWLGFNQNDNQILSLCKKLTNPNDFSQISVDWFEQALRKLGNLGQHMQQQFGLQQQQQQQPFQQQQDQQFNWEQQNFLNNMPENIKDTADEIAEAVVEDKVGMYAFKKYDQDNRGKIMTRQLDQIIYVDLHFEKDQFLDNFINSMSKNGQVDLKLLEKVLNNKGTLSKFQQNQNAPTTEMFGIGRFNEQSPAKKLSQQDIGRAQQLVEIIKKQYKSEDQINDYFFPLGSPSAINLQMFQDKMRAIKTPTPLKQEDIQLLFDYLDASSNGVLTAQEFRLIFENQSTKKNVHNIKITGRLQDEVRALFQSLDKNNNNSLDQAELSQGLQQIGICPNPTELQEYFRRIDLDHNGVIDYSEFSNFIIQKLKEEMVSLDEFQANIRREFKRVDINKTRLLSRSQMETLFRNLGYELDRQEFEILFHEIDQDQSGLIDIDELIYFLSSNKKDCSETAKMAVLNINCAHISISDLASTFKSLPEAFIHSFLRKINRQGLNLPANALKLQLDHTKLYYKDLFFLQPSGIDQFYAGASTVTKSVLRKTTDVEWFEIKFNQITGVPIPENKKLILGRELKFCLMDSVTNFVANTAKVKAYWNQQYEDRWQFQPTGSAPQSSAIYDAPMKDENQLIVRIKSSELEKIQKLIIELVIYIRNQEKVISISCGWAEILIKDLINQNRMSFEVPIQSGIPANSKTISNVKVQRKGWSKFVQKLSSPIKSQISFEVAKPNKFPNEYKEVVNSLPSTIILNKVHLNYFAIYREYVALKVIDPQYNRGGMTLHKSPKVKAFVLGVNSMDFVEFITRYWLRMETSQQFRELSKSNEELFRMKIKLFEAIQDQAYLLINNLGFKYNFADPTYPTHYDHIAKNRNALYNDFMQTVTSKLTPSRGQPPKKADWYNNLEPFNTAQLSDDEDDNNLILSKFKAKVQKQSKTFAQTSYPNQFNQNSFNQQPPPQKQQFRASYY